MIKVVAKVVAKPEKVNETETIMKSLIPITQKEKGCISYELFQETAKRNTYFFVETWGSKEALDQHLSNDQYDTFFKSRRRTLFRTARG
ncbi:MAG: antibiotic biosynthesis monooxygenase [Flavobacterium sp.]|nr:MAG: antibiotic biosynthesis monooxygenase [Flavobacterium sp.]